MKRCAALLLLFSLGCDQLVRVGPPPLPDDRAGSLLLLQIEAERPLAAVAISTPPLGASASTIQLDPSERSDLWLLDQACPLDTLGLLPGPQRLELCEPECLGQERLPSSRALFRAQVSGDQVEPWRKADALDDAASALLGRLPVPADRACRLRLPAYGLEAERVELPAALGLGKIEGLALLASGRIALGMGFFADLAFDDRLGTGLYLLELGAGPAQPVPGFPDGRVLGLFARGERFYGYICGQVWEGSPEGAFSVTATLAGFSCSQGALTGAPEAMPFELFLASSGEALTLHHIDASGIREIYNQPQPGRSVRVALSYVAPGEVIGVGLAGPKTALHYAAGAITREPLPCQGAVQSVAVVPGLGVLAGSDLGEIMLREDAGWRLIDRPFVDTVRAIVPAGGAAMALGCDFANCMPQVALFDGAGACSPDPLPIFYAGQMLALADGQILVLDGGQTAANLNLVHITPERAPVACARP